MSAYIVDRETIDVIVTAAGPSSRAMGDRWGRMLWRENLHSVAYRYPSDGDGDRPGPVGFRDADVDAYAWLPTVVPSMDLVDHLESYTYQSCEHPGWEDSGARFLILDLKARALGGAS